MTILDEIVEAKKKKLKSIRLDSSFIKPQNVAKFLEKGKKSIIAEIKRGSPSLGLFKPDLDVAATANYYKRIGAAAISVLTEEDYFYGSSEDLLKVKEVGSLPVLRKDFTFTEEQIMESAQLGASAILLIVAVIKDKKRLEELLNFSKEYGLAVLVETHTKAEIFTALDAGAQIVGVNNRNLHNFKTDIGASLELIRHIPKDVIRVTESGIKTKADIDNLYKAGYEAFLIGEAFLRNPNFL